MLDGATRFVFDCGVHPLKKENKQPIEKKLECYFQLKRDEAGKLQVDEYALVADSNAPASPA